MSATAQPKMGMIAAWRALATIIGDLCYNGLQLVSYNLIWFVVSLPLITPALVMFMYARAVRYLLAAQRGQDPTDI